MDTYKTQKNFTSKRRGLRSKKSKTKNVGKPVKSKKDSILQCNQKPKHSKNLQGLPKNG